jgi:hypothetical protein
MKVCYECYADGTVLRACGFGRMQVDHKRSKYRVVWAVLRLDGRLGLVDEDPGQTPSDDLARFRMTQHGHDLMTLEYEGLHLVVIRPRLEEWLLRTARLAHIDVRDYGLPDEAEKLHGIIDEELDKLDRLLQALKGHERMRALNRSLRSCMS